MEDIRQGENKKGGGQEKQEKKKDPVVVVLKGAASLTSRGEKFIRDVPREVADKNLAKRLLASSLFEKKGD